MILIFFEKINIFFFLKKLLTNLFFLIIFFNLKLFFKNTKFFLFFYFLIFFNDMNKIIPGLQNNLFIIHPILYIICFIIFIKSFFLKKLVINAFFLSLFLGGFWATQEFNWGGWWNWDLIETPTLYITIIIYYHIHKYTVRISNFWFKKYTFWIKYDFFSKIFYIPKVLNLNSIHSFVNNFNLLSILFFYGILNNFILKSIVIYLSFLIFFNINSLFYIKYFILFYFFIFLYKLFYLLKIKVVLYHKWFFLFLFFYIWNMKKINILIGKTNYITYIYSIYTKNQFNFNFFYKNFYFYKNFWEKFNIIKFSNNLFFFKKSIFF